MTSQELEIIKSLNEDAYTTIDEISLRTSFSSSLIRNTLSALGELDIGCNILSKIGEGYRLEITDRTRFANIVLSESTGREAELILILLAAKEPLRIEAISNRLNVSRATVDRILVDARKELHNYDLKIASKSKNGIQVEGNEKNIRLCYSRYMRYYVSSGEQNELQLLRRILYKIFDDYDYQMSDQSFENLIYHLYIAVNRISDGNDIQNLAKDKNHIMQTKEYSLAKTIASSLEEVFHIEFSENETIYITAHLLGKQIFSDYYLIDEEVVSQVKEILEEIYVQKGIDLREDGELVRNLSLHIQPLVSRLAFGLRQENPLINDIKREMSEAFELAILTKNHLEAWLQKEINEYEVGYLALHFALSLEKKNNRNAPIRILVVCSTGAGTARLLKQKVMHQFDLKEENIDLCSVFQLRKMEDFSGYTCILSTIPISLSVSVPLIIIDAILKNEMSVKRIQKILYESQQEETIDYFKEDAFLCLGKVKDREEALKLLAEKMTEVYHLDPEFYSQIWEREKLSSTEVGNFVAFPHPLSYSGEPYLGVMVLKKAIVWNATKVKYLFMLSSPMVESEKSRRVNETVTNLICDPELLLKIEKKPEAETVRECLRSAQ